MQYIKIGIPYVLELISEEGTAFESVPCARLYHPTSKFFVTAEIKASENEGNYIAKWDTSDMPTGNYSLEIYQDDTLQVMMKDYPKQNYAVAILVSVSNNNGNK